MDVDPGLLQFARSRARVLVLGVLANSEVPLTGYRVAKIADVPEIKAYRILKDGVRVGLVQKRADGFRLVDVDLRTYLQKKIRLRWSEEPRIAKRSAGSPRSRDEPREFDWYHPADYRPNGSIASRYAREFHRPPEKDEPFATGRPVGSRKRR